MECQGLPHFNFSVPCKQRSPQYFSGNIATVVNLKKKIMKISGKSIRTFIGSKNYNVSRNFYSDLGFKEIVTSEKMSYFHIGEFGFYLQDAYVKDWIDNSMIFFEVENLESTLKYIRSLKLTEKYKDVRLSEIVYNEWGNEFFLHDPCGILWHFGKFKK